MNFFVLNIYRIQNILLDYFAYFIFYNFLVLRRKWNCLTQIVTISVKQVRSILTLNKLVSYNKDITTLNKYITTLDKDITRERSMERLFPIPTKRNKEDFEQLRLKAQDCVAWRNISSIVCRAAEGETL